MLHGLLLAELIRQNRLLLVSSFRLVAKDTEWKLYFGICFQDARNDAEQHIYQQLNLKIDEFLELGRCLEMFLLCDGDRRMEEGIHTTKDMCTLK